MFTNEQLLTYLKFAIDNNYLTKLKWMTSVFAFIAEKLPYENEYVLVTNTSITLKCDSNITIDKSYVNPILNSKDKVAIPANFLPNNKKAFDTTIGRVVMNHLLLSKALNNKVAYLNKSFTIGEIESDYIAKQLTSDLTKEDGILVKDYLAFIDTVSFVDNLAKYLSIGVTEKSLLPPPDMTEFREKSMDALLKKYGEDGILTPQAIAELEATLVAHDEEYLKDDPSNNKLVGKKVKAVARKKYYTAMGVTSGLDGSSGVNFNTLEKGWSKDKELLAALFNDIRSGSLSRGDETKLGGVTATTLMRAITGLLFVPGDCGNKVTMTTFIDTKLKSIYLGRTVIVGKSKTLLTDDNIDKFTNKNVELVSAGYCKQKDGFCTTCTNISFTDRPDALLTLAPDISAALLKFSLSKFHATTLTLTEIDLDLT